jgi:hypothetical protein
MLKEVVIIVYPLIAGVRGVLYIDKGGTRGVLLLKKFKEVKDYIKLLI